MIMWTLDLLDWLRDQLADRWPEVRLRGGETDFDPEPYRIRLRENGKQYWLFFSPDAIRGTGVADVASLLERSDWISMIRNTGGISVTVSEPRKRDPILVPWPALGPEVRVESGASA
jgi:hypothetical protein